MKIRVLLVTSAMLAFGMSDAFAARNYMNAQAHSYRHSMPAYRPPPPPVRPYITPQRHLRHHYPHNTTGSFLPLFGFGVLGGAFLYNSLSDDCRGEFLGEDELGRALYRNICE